MGRRGTAFGVCAVTVGLLAGCATHSLETVRSAYVSGEGTQRLEEWALPDAYSVALEFFRKAGNETKLVEGPDQSFILEQHHGGGRGAGAYVGVWFSPCGTTCTKIKVVTQPEDSWIAGWTETGLLNAFEIVMNERRSEAGLAAPMPLDAGVPDASK